MNMKMAMTTVAGLALAGAAVACECDGTAKKATGLTSVTNTPAVVHVGQVGKHKSAGKNQELKVIITDGEARFWVNGKEVDRSAFAKAGGDVVISAQSVPTPPTMEWAATPRGLAAAPKPVRLGVVLGEVSDELADKLDVDSDGVILIERVMDGTPAAKAGLKSFDVLVEFDGEDDLSIEKLRKLIGKQSPGDSVEVIVLRDGDDEEIEVVFGGDIEANQFVVAPTPPHGQNIARAPKVERFFGREMNKEAQAHLKEALEHAELQAHKMQKHANKWQAELKQLYSDANKDGMNFEFRFDGDDREEIEKAMALLHEHLGELDLEFDFGFDGDDFPRIRFIEDQMHENAGKLKERAAVLERRIMQKHEREMERQAQDLEREAERMERRILREAEREMQRRERVEEGAERQIEKLERRIEELEAMIEKLVSKLEQKKPRGVRN